MGAEGNIQLRLTDVAGRVIRDMMVANKAGDVISMPVDATLANGTYFLQVFAPDHSVIASKTLVKN